MISKTLKAKPFLEDLELAEVHRLADRCTHADGTAAKINWGMMAERDITHINDLCCYINGQLVGYMPIDAFGEELEITALVLPEYRGQGIFRLLFEAARLEASNRKARQLLAVAYRAIESGKAVAEHLGLAYEFSEYHMHAQIFPDTHLPESVISLEEAAAENVGELSRLISLNFKDSEWNTSPFLLKEMEGSDKHYYLAKLGDQFIGHIGTVNEEASVYIRAVGIASEWRHRGYGRQLLAALLSKLIAEGCQTFELDVATENSSALSLYQSCGFQETTIYDYYRVPLP